MSPCSLPPNAITLSSPLPPALGHILIKPVHQSLPGAVACPSPSEPRRQLVPQSDIVPSLSIPGVEIRRARPFPNISKAPVAKKNSGHHAKLKRLPRNHSYRQPSAAAFFAGHRQSDVIPGVTTGNVSVVDRSATQYSVEVVLNGSPVNLIMNTAGSDTWVRSRNFTCLNNAGGSAPISQCDWGKFGATGFPNGPIQDQHFAIKNIDGSGVSGQLGYMDVSIANVTVPNQEVAIATQGVWHGDNVTSGMLGMAYPSLTSAYSGDDLNDTSNESALEYSPLFTTMMTDGFVRPYWSLAISRNSSDGLFCLGDLPPLNFTWEHIAKADLLIAKLSNKKATAYQPSYYATVSDGFLIGNTDIGESYPVIFDSSTTLAYLPPDVAETVNSHFQPPATYLWYYGSYFVPCDATPPPFSVMLQNSPFSVNPKDMINHDVVDPLTKMCQVSYPTKTFLLQAPITRTDHECR
ncbi:hypothetical protein PG993_007380 [Apiospora rasikravindrae]|uniref:Peptidase A1 domain-containing protein n=1 Tax=Apiospora rasikravindrae TaxID=990691 RepID=A0ABR1SXB9_9PEZI